jgi:hypothetical protein
MILTLAVAGCGHRLVAPPGETAALIFPDRKTLKPLSRDDYSVEVVVTGGPYKGLHGFVMKEAFK